MAHAFLLLLYKNTWVYKHGCIHGCMKKKLQEKDFVGYNEYLKNKNRMNEMLYNNWKFIHKKSVVKIVTGLSLIMIGVVTLPIPTGSIPLIIIGLSLVSAGGIDILALKNTIYWRIITRFRMRRNK